MPSWTGKNKWDSIQMYFLADSVEYLELNVDKQALHPLEWRWTALKSAPPPKVVHQLRSFLGMANHYIEFIMHSATMLKQLYQLLAKNVKCKLKRRSGRSRSGKLYTGPLRPRKSHHSQMACGLTFVDDHVTGHPFEVHSNHKPLLGLVGEDRCIQIMTPPRMQRWTLTLPGYQYKLMYIPGWHNAVLPMWSTQSESQIRMKHFTFFKA